MSKSTEDGKNSEHPAPFATDSSQNTAGPSQNMTARGTGGGLNAAGQPRIIGSQAKKQEEVTRQGTQKMKFVPTLPVRRKKPDTELKQDSTAPPSPSKPTERGRGRGRGLGRGRGGPPPSRPEMQMTASGPFAMGPALAGSSKRRAPRSNFTPIMPMGPGSTSLGDGLSRTAAPTLNREREQGKRGIIKEEDEDVEVYSDPDEGIQIVDMDAIKTMDWMAPESLKRERDEGKKSKKKAEAMKKDAKGKGKAKDEPETEMVETEMKKNLANALDLSESEEEEEMEDLIGDFAMESLDIEDDDTLTRQEKLYFFQFPQPFPTFSIPGDGVATGVEAMAVDGHKPAVEDQQPSSVEKGKKVTFAKDVKPPASDGVQGNQEKEGVQGSTQEGAAVAAKSTDEKRLDGIIGQLEVHRSGMIKMRLNNGMLMDVTAATQPSFLQHAVFLDPTAKKLHVLGEVNRRFVVSPDVDKLLEEIEKAEAATQVKTEAPEVTVDTN